MTVWYMSGAGNDFMVLDGRGMEADWSALAKELCKLADCDGFMAVDHSAVADFKLHFYNADGSRGEMCGNGSRCVSKFAHDNGIAPADMTIETDAGLLRSTRISENQYRVRLNEPGIVDLHRCGDMAYVELGDPGVPHGVYRYEGLSWDLRDRLRERMRAERFAEYFPKGANVNYYDFLDETTVRILTFERGVEDFTLACGTGSGSVATVLWLTGKIPEGRVRVVNPGGTLEFEIEGENGTVTRLLMTGPAELVKVYEL